MNRMKLKEVVIKVLKEMNDEGKYQGYAKGSFKKMLVKIAQGKVLPFLICRLCFQKI